MEFDWLKVSDAKELYPDLFQVYRKYFSYMNDQAITLLVSIAVSFRPTPFAPDKSGESASQAEPVKEVSSPVESEPL